ncbi:MAG: class I tRNA ligase family protein, partial [Gemmatimonadetes bacterium]|nr:class I tRNA ligase family protein [Gemmatimonadota bacterium]NIS02395.1 class I tRNA ligase family protein [Gemmatimonadota bacterium]NIT68299.1 class I tRNA ligase family protein [Gemmatimonadota bacterium]NIU54754.1 class I tRNA ligase family protein [Gemmatimonadota bacterium]NIV24871.1 class I tRNA ligase family protein [Gemmatimonadota bacterium]
TEFPARETLELSDRWILSRLAEAAREVTDNLERFRLHEAAAGIYRFFWSEFCDWYLELVKPRLYDEADGETRTVARAVLCEALDVSFRLMHPIMPFVSEELWSRLPERDADSLMIAAWPRPPADWDDPAAETEFATLQELLGAVRNIRSEYGVAHGQEIAVEVRSADQALRRALAAEGDSARKLGGIGRLSFNGD